MNPHWRTILLIAVVAFSPDALAAAGTSRLIVPEGETLTIRVTDPDGKPLADASVWVTFELSSEQPELITGADGEVQLRGVPRSVRIGVEVCRQGSMPAVSWLSSVPEDRLDVVLSPAAALTGTVVDADGSPVAGAWVFAHLNGTPEGQIGRYGKHCPAADSPDVSTDGEGRFTIAPLKPGWYQMRAALGILTSPTLPAVEARLGSRNDLSLTLPRGIPFAISGRVTDATGAPVAGVYVTVFEPSSSLTDADGRYRLEGFIKKDPEPNVISVWTLGPESVGIRKEIEITAGETVLDLVFNPEVPQ